jgi:hypothetical protein
MSGPSTISIKYNNVEISTDVIYSSVSFESQLSAQPGTFEMTVRDPNQTHSFITGKEIVLTLDSKRLFGGYLTQVSRTHAFPAADTTTPSAVKERQWVLRGVDYNILFDKLVFRYPTSYTTQPPNEANTSYDGALVKKLCSTYLDIPAGFDTTTLVQNVTQPAIDAPFFQWYSTGNNIQGTTWRQQMDDLAINCGTIYYINADKKLIYKAIEDTQAIWGFSDVPNKLPLNGTPSPLATYGFRELDATEDGSIIVNDALIWGGSAIGDPSGAGIFFARAQDATSESIHGRWQYAENHAGQTGFGSQHTVTVRANQIVSGTDGGTDPSTGTRRGYLNPQWSFRFAWFGQDVPVYAGQPQHLNPGDLVTIVLFVMEDANWPSGLIQLLPLRQTTITIVTLSDGLPYVRFDGMFGLLADDPFTLWRYLLARQRIVQGSIAGIANDSSTTTTYGAFGQFTLLPAADGTNKVFHVPNDLGFISGTQVVTVDLLFQRPGFEYTVSNAAIGQITFTTAPHSGAALFIYARML